MKSFGKFPRSQSLVPARNEIKLSKFIQSSHKTPPLPDLVKAFFLQRLFQLDFYIRFLYPD